MRAPAVFSALGDPLAGARIARAPLPPRGETRAAAAAAALYLSGMALNDFADRREDARDRPERPIPTGAIPAAGAAALGFGLLSAGVLLGRRAGAGWSSAALAATIAAYNFRLKHSPVAGPAAMGACRALSLLMGAEAAGGFRGVRRATGPAALLGGYVAGVTVLARGETGERSPGTVRRGIALAGAALLGTAVRGGRQTRPWAGIAAALAGPATLRALWNPRPARVGPAVGALIRAIPALDAALVAPHTPRRAAALAPPLLALTRWGRRLIPIT